MDYLKSRGVYNKRYFSFLRSGKFGLLDNAIFTNGENEYEITHFLSNSAIAGYDIKSVNRVLKLDGTNEIAIALVSGDDVICYNILTNEVTLWQIQTGEGEKTNIAESLDDFFAIIK